MAGEGGGGAAYQQLAAELELGLIQSHMAQKPMLRGVVGVQKKPPTTSGSENNNLTGSISQLIPAHRSCDAGVVFREVMKRGDGVFGGS